MFGIGLPEFILILALALIVVGPEKLPDLAKTLAKQLMELKKTASALQDSLKEELKEAERTVEESEQLKEGKVAALPEGEKDEAGNLEDVHPVIDIEARPTEAVYREAVKAATPEADEATEQAEKKS
ncbi:MAG: twin-arginine translocase TatA/TatE family subunit [Proteobacteria bacterium]|nr:twin-arginine translocase TatA/TatE family subunit [Pseudomonadota bacterium]